MQTLADAGSDIAPSVADGLPDEVGMAARASGGDFSIKRINMHSNSKLN
jgi:hypothetical protein